MYVANSVISANPMTPLINDNSRFHMISTGSTYPLDIVRSRLSIATASVALATSASSSVTSASARIPAGELAQHALFHTTATAAAPAYSKADLTIWGMALKIVREEGGVRGLYRGLVTTAVGVAPYVGINFAAYEFLRGIITPPGKSNVVRKLTCGALAGRHPHNLIGCGAHHFVHCLGTISQTLTYPFDVLRRKMQVTGMKDGAVKYAGAVDALRSIFRVEGVAGLYRGLWPNLRKSRV